VVAWICTHAKPGSGLNYNCIYDISPIKTLVNITVLKLAGNLINDISALSFISNLGFLNLDANNIHDISPIGNLSELYHVRLENNQITDLEEIINNSGIGNGDYLMLSGNPLNEVAITIGIPRLVERGVSVYWDDDI
jgi:internalin A